MSFKFNPRENYEKTRKEIGFVALKEADRETWERIGFMSGLEIHQQLDTDKKLFCRCPVGIFHDFEDYDAEIIRHMRPTLSELGEYDGTALMEFKTKKEITYRINNETACTYEIDDTPPFPMNREALKYAVEISLMLHQYIVGEVHITRKQYLDGSIPAGFQRTAIIGVEGSFPIKNKKIRMIQMSIEEDSCREISDYRHKRMYMTDRLGTPLIEMVTYPDMINPYEAAEAAQYLRFLVRSTGKVRTGIGASRQDVNVSCKGGTRIEIKGVGHIARIPDLTHIEAFRQWALLHIRDEIKNLAKENWKIESKVINDELISENMIQKPENWHYILVRLPDFRGILSHFTQPGKIFADEISDRLKVISCLEKPNMHHSEELEPVISEEIWDILAKELPGSENDAYILFPAPEEDRETALETVEERCLAAFDGVPEETRKSFADGTTVFERVLPGADRMYPDTDSAPIPVSEDFIEDIRKQLPVELEKRIAQFEEWKLPTDTFTYLFRNNLMKLIDEISSDLNIDPREVGKLMAHRIKFRERKDRKPFNYKILKNLLAFVQKEKIEFEIVPEMIKVLMNSPEEDFSSVLKTIKFNRFKQNEITSEISAIRDKLALKKDISKEKIVSGIMGFLRPRAIGDLSLAKLNKIVTENVERGE
ncbi:MAG: Glu-tRNA(Gln) amidotransferase GatDE subunit E [Candidatus Cloacimonadota bacterium]|nr:MAG: Glu-tRNA(Gln) amidotransferase GatDE subunit E [Candidatus Cloacimonadota bacterium]